MEDRTCCPDLTPGQSITATIKETGERLSGEIQIFCPKLKVLWIDNHTLGGRRMISLEEVHGLNLRPMSSRETDGRAVNF